MKKLRLALPFLLLTSFALIAGCFTEGGSDEARDVQSAGACTFPDEYWCQNDIGSAWAKHSKSNCTQNNGVYSSSCSTEGALGGVCTVNAGSPHAYSIVHYQGFAGGDFSAEDSKENCDLIKGDWEALGES